MNWVEGLIREVASILYLVVKWIGKPKKETKPSQAKTIQTEPSRIESEKNKKGKRETI